MHRTAIGLFLVTSCLHLYAFICPEIPNVWTDKGSTQAICRGTFFGFKQDKSCSNLFEPSARKICRIIRTGLAPNENSCLVYLQLDITQRLGLEEPDPVRALDLSHTLFSYRFCRGVKALSASSEEVLQRLQRPKFNSTWARSRELQDAGIPWSDLSLQTRENAKLEIIKIKHAYITTDEFLKLFLRSFNLNWENSPEKITMGNPIKYAIRAGFDGVTVADILSHFESDQRQAILSTWQQAWAILFPQPSQIPMAIPIEEPSAPPWDSKEDYEMF